MLKTTNLRKRGTKAVKLKILILSFLAVFLMAGSAMAVPYTIDGNVGDWGIDLSLALDAGYLDTNKPGGNVDVVTEDNTDIDDGWFQVGPGWSNDNSYDAEAMYFDNDETYGYIAIITGVASDATWAPGDIGINVGSDTAELIDNGSSTGKTTPYEFGIDIESGDLSNVMSWESAYYDGSPGPDYAQYSDPWTIFSGSKIRDTTLCYSSSAIQGHYVIEASFLLADLGLSPGDVFDIHWTMQCGNDYLNLRADVNPVPEPATMLLLGTGLVCFAGFGRKRFFKRG